MIGKSERGPAGIEAIKKHEAVYLMAVGGAAYLVSKAITKSRVVAFADLGMEAIYEFEVKDMPVTVAVDARGNSVHVTGPRELDEDQGTEDSGAGRLRRSVPVPVREVHHDADRRPDDDPPPRAAGQRCGHQCAEGDSERRDEIHRRNANARAHFRPRPAQDQHARAHDDRRDQRADRHHRTQH